MNKLTVIIFSIFVFAFTNGSYASPICEGENDSTNRGVNLNFGINFNLEDNSNINLERNRRNCRKLIIKFRVLDSDRNPMTNQAITCENNYGNGNVDTHHRITDGLGESNDRVVVTTDHGSQLRIQVDDPHDPDNYTWTYVNIGPPVPGEPSPRDIGDVQMYHPLNP